MKITNEYCGILGQKMFERIPKAVLAAIVVSFAHRLSEETFDAVPGLVMDEWQALFDNGIVPQRPAADLRFKFAGSSRTAQETVQES